MIMAPAAPMTMRAAINSPDELASSPAYNADPPKSARPICMMPLRPKRSPRELIVNSNPANTRE